MKWLTDLPIVIYIATWVWGEDTTVTPQKCLDTLPIMLGPCWTGLLAKGIGVAIILAACINKLPIILNLLSSRSAEGTPSSAVYGETLVYANSAVYGWLNQHPFTAWGENLGLLLQSLMILFLIWQYAPPSYTERSLFSLSVVLYVSTIATGLLPPTHYHWLVASSLPLLLAARGAQILTTWHCQHTGSQSIVTVGLNLLGALVRVATTLREVGWDWAMLGTLLVSGVLSLVLCGQMVWYRQNTARFLAELKEESAKKKTE